MNPNSLNNQKNPNQIARLKLDKRLFLLLIPGISLISILDLYSSVSIIRLIAGVPIIFILPGFLFILVLWPPKSNLEPIRRIALIIPTSVAIVGILLLVVNYFFTYTYESVVVAMASLEIFLTVIVYFRTALSTSYTVVFSRFRKFATALTSQDLKTGHIFLGISILVFLTSIAYTTFTPRQIRDITEFFLLEPDRFMDHQPLTVKQRDPFNPMVAVRNLESTNHEYHIEVWGVGQFGENREFLTRIGRFILDQNDMIILSFPPVMPTAGSNQGVEILLYVDDEPEPHRRIYVNNDVED